MYAACYLFTDKQIELVTSPQLTCEPSCKSLVAIRGGTERLKYVARLSCPASG